jgi:hypothetical protein
MSEQKEWPARGLPYAENGWLHFRTSDGGPAVVRIASIAAVTQEWRAVGFGSAHTVLVLDGAATVAVLHDLRDIVPLIGAGT